MALTSAHTVKASLESIYATFVAEATKPGTRRGVEALNEVAHVLNSLYEVFDVAVAADAGVAEMIAATGALAAYDVGVVFRATGTTDLVDLALATAKGSALAIDDIFCVSGADAVTYLGNGEALNVFDMSGETSQDFVNV